MIGLGIFALFSSSNLYSDENIDMSIVGISNHGKKRKYHLNSWLCIMEGVKEKSYRNIDPCTVFIIHIRCILCNKGNEIHNVIIDEQKKLCKC